MSFSNEYSSFLKKSCSKSEKSKNVKSYHLSEEDRIFIISQLLIPKTPQQIRFEWNRERKKQSLSSIYDLKKKYQRTGNISNRKGQGRKKTSVTEENMQKIYEKLRQQNIQSQVQLSHLVGMKRSSLRRCLKVMKLKSYKIRHVHFLSEVNKKNRVIFCRQFKRLNFQIRRNIWFSDEASFTLDQIPNMHNLRCIGEKNEQQKFEVQRRSKSFDVWAAINGHGKIVYDVFTGNQKAKDYELRLRKMFPRMKMTRRWFM